MAVHQSMCVPEGGKDRMEFARNTGNIDDCVYTFPCYFWDVCDLQTEIRKMGRRKVASAQELSQIIRVRISDIGFCGVHVGDS